MRISSQNHSRLVYSLGVGFLLAVDQVTKTQFFLPSHSLNTGVSFGWGNEINGGWLLFLLALVCMAVAIGWWRSSHTWRWSLSWILAGGLGNLIDRWQWGGVRDWMQVPGIALHNNAADWMIVVGVLGAGLTWWYHTEYRKQKESAGNN